MSEDEMDQAHFYPLEEEPEPTKPEPVHLAEEPLFVALLRDAVAGLSISFPIGRLQNAWIPVVKEAGRTLSRRLGYRGPDAPRMF